MLVNMTELLNFCDNNKQARDYSNAVKTVAMEELSLAVLKKFMNQKRWQPTVCTNRKPNQGKSGKRLDAWVHVVERKQPFWYQVEVKSWSLHGYGRRTGQLPADACSNTLSAFMIERFGEYWNKEEGCFRDRNNSLNKVLLQMRAPPKRNPPEPNAEVRPLACLWTPIQPKGDVDKPFFRVDKVNKQYRYRSVWIFSVSGYLRKLLRNGHHNMMNIELPRTQETLRYLNNIFGNHS